MWRHHRLAAAGTPPGESAPQMSAHRDRLLQVSRHIEIGAVGSCWIWRAATTGQGYGVTEGLTGCQTPAHRLVYELLVGPIPDGLELDHLCRVRACVNPEHLEPVTHAENMRRANSLRTHCKWGHEFNDENTLVLARGDRHCRPCHRRRMRERYWRLREGITK